MKPKIKKLNGKSPLKDSSTDEDFPVQERAVLQIEDDSLSANQVLREQKVGRSPDEPAALFVP